MINKNKTIEILSDYDALEERLEHIYSLISKIRDEVGVYDSLVGRVLDFRNDSIEIIVEVNKVKFRREINLDYLDYSDEQIIEAETNKISKNAIYREKLANDKKQIEYLEIERLFSIHPDYFTKIVNKEKK